MRNTVPPGRPPKVKRTAGEKKVKALLHRLTASEYQRLGVFHEFLEKQRKVELRKGRVSLSGVSEHFALDAALLFGIQTCELFNISEWPESKHAIFLLCMKAFRKWKLIDPEPGDEDSAEVDELEPVAHHA